MVEPVSVVGVEGGTIATEPELLKGGLEYVARPYPTTTNNGERTGNILITILVKLIVIVLENFISIPNFYFVYSIREQKKHPMFTTFVLVNLFLAWVQIFQTILSFLLTFPRNFANTTAIAVVLGICVSL